MRNLLPPNRNLSAPKKNLFWGRLGALLNDFQAEEKGLNLLSARMLAAVGAIYGKNSNEYEQAGGKRASEIKR